MWLLRATTLAVAALLVGCGHSPTPRPSPVDTAKLTGQVAYSARDDIWVAPANGRGAARRLTSARGPEDDPSWSPDGRQIAYRDSHRGYNVNDDIYVMNADGSGKHDITPTPSNQWSPAWSPDGRWIAFYDGQLWMAHPDGSGRRRITQIEGEYPDWSPDSRRLAFMSSPPNARGRNPEYEIYVVDRDGRHLRRLTSFPGEDGWPAWSPDGTWIAFTSTHDDRGQFAGGLYRDVWVMRPDGSAKRRLVTKISAAFPVWSPDGKNVMVVGNRPGRDEDLLWVVRADGSGLKQIRWRGTLPDWTR